MAINPTMSKTNGARPLGRASPTGIFGGGQARAAAPTRGATPPKGNTGKGGTGKGGTGKPGKGAQTSAGSNSLTGVPAGIAGQFQNNMQNSEALAANAAQAANTQIQKGGPDYSNAPQLVGGNDLAGFQGQITDKVYNDMVKRVNINADHARSDFDQKMADQGVVEGSDLYNRLKTQNEQGINDMYTQTDAQATQLGQQQAQQLYGQSLQGRQEGVTEANNLYQYPMNTYATMQQQFNPYLQANSGYQQTGLAGQYSLKGAQAGASGQVGAASVAANASQQNTLANNATNMAIAQMQNPSGATNTGNVIGSIAGPIVGAAVGSIFGR